MINALQPINNPIFLVGAERSGTTLLRLMLCHHPQIAWYYEFEYAVNQFSNSGEFPDLKKYYKYLETNRIFLASQLKIDQTLSYPELIKSFLEQYRRQEDKLIIGATVHHHFDRILSIWPKTRFIHLIRDGRAVACSCIDMGWAGNVWNGVEFWITAESLWNTLNHQLPAERKLEIFYEDLIINTVETLTRICEFIGVSYDPSMLDYAQKTTYGLPDATLVKQWQQKLTDQEIRLIESRIGSMLEKRGYSLSGLPAISLSSLSVAQLKIQNWWKCLEFRIKRFGLGLILADFISRQLNLKNGKNKLESSLT